MEERNEGAILVDRMKGGAQLVPQDTQSVHVWQSSMPQWYIIKASAHFCGVLISWNLSWRSCSTWASVQELSEQWLSDCSFFHTQLSKPGLCSSLSLHWTPQPFVISILFIKIFCLKLVVLFAFEISPNLSRQISGLSSLSHFHLLA